MIKILTESDYPDLKNNFTLDESAFVNYFLNDKEPRYNSYGFYENDQTQSIISVIDSLEIPAWILSRHNSFYQIDHFKIFCQEFIEIKEKQNLNQFFTVLREEEISVFSSIFSRYQPYVEHKLFAGQLTDYENIDHDVLEYRTFNEDMLILLWVLKNEHRAH